MSYLSPYLDEKIFLSRDGQQMEIRMLAQLSGDKLLIYQLNTGEDIHPQVAHSVFGWPLEKAKKDEKSRTIAKQLHFGIVFGLQDNGIYEQCKRKGIKTTLQEVSDARKNYFKKYVGVSEFIQYCIEYAQEHGHTIPNLFGMTRELVIGGDRGNGSFWGNQSVNTPVQGSAAQVLILALAIMKEKEKECQLVRKHMENEIHDSLVATPRLRDLVATDALLQDIMERMVVEELLKRFNVKMLVPLTTDAAVGFRLGTMVKDYDRYKQSLEEVVDLWCKKNQDVENWFVKDPLRFVELQRGQGG